MDSYLQQVVKEQVNFSYYSMTIEKFDASTFKPGLRLRIHHYTDSLPVRLAFRRFISPKTLVDRQIAKLVENRDSNDPHKYYADLIGFTDTDLARFQNGLYSFYEQLRTFPDSGFVELGLEPDPICDNCAIAKHCRSTNFSVGGRPIDVFNSEGKRLEETRASLEKEGFRRGINFIEIEDTRELKDLQGEPLDTDTQPKLKTATYLKLIAQAQALRTIIPAELIQAW